MRKVLFLAAAAAFALSGCSGNKDAGKVPEEKKVGNFVYAPPPGANGKAQQPGSPGVAGNQVQQTTTK